MKAAVRSLVARSKPAVIAWEIAAERVPRRTFYSGPTMSPDDAAAYVESTFRSLTSHGGAEWAGRRVLELGPGDNLGLAGKFAELGAEVTCLDRFAVDYDRAWQEQVYERLGVDVSGVRVVDGHGIEDAPFDPESFDLIYSIAVLEHVQDLDSAFEAMDRVLRPGGLLLHQVDLQDHGMFSGHPLRFLTISDRVYALMGAERGRPNRRLTDYYRDRLSALGYDFELEVSRWLPRREVSPYGPDLEPSGDPALAESIRPKLNPRYRTLPAGDLLTAGLFITARK